MKQRFTTTYRRFSISSCLFQQLPAYILFSNRLSLHKLFQFLEIFIGIKGNTITLSPITTSPACLLVITFKTLRYIIMDNKSDIWFINAHTESYGSHNDIDFFHQKIILRFRTGCRIHSSMVSFSLYIICT